MNFKNFSIFCFLILGKNYFLLEDEQSCADTKQNSRFRGKILLNLFYF